MALAVLSGLVLPASLASAETYYVSLAGDDAQDGKSEQTAVRTFKKGVAMLKAGDTLILKPGDHGAEGAEMLASGTKEAPITIRGEKPGEAVLRAPLRIIGKSHIVVEGLKFVGAKAAVNIKDASTHVTVKKCIFEKCPHFGILLYGSFKDPGASHHHVFSENQFFDYADSGPGSPTDGKGISDYGMCLYASTDVEATNNYFYGHFHQALSFKKLMRRSRAANNTFEGFYYSAIVLGQNDDYKYDDDNIFILRSSNLIAEGNVFRPTQKYRAKRPISVGNVSDAVVRYNFVDNLYGGDAFGCIEVGANSTGARIYGNLIVNGGATQAGIHVAGDAEVYNNTIANCNVGLSFFHGTKALVRNNIFYNNKTQVLFRDAPAARLPPGSADDHMSGYQDDGRLWTWRPDASKKPVFEGNCWFPDGPDRGAADISAEPKFTGPFAEPQRGEMNPQFVPDFERAGAYRLAVDSTCIDRGAKVADWPSAGAAPDIGCFEHGGQTGPGKKVALPETKQDKDGSKSR
jgi:hypothetical protein